MQVQVRFAGSMRDLAESSDLVVRLPDQARLVDLLGQLQKVLPERFCAMVIDPILAETEKAPAVLTINRKTISSREAFIRLLQNGDSIVFVPPMEGG